jgi:uncharacterized membrane protein YadS
MGIAYGYIGMRDTWLLLNVAIADSRSVSSSAPGLLLTCAVAVVATAIGSAVPLVGAPVSGIVLGVLLSWMVGPRLRPGVRFASRRVLQVAVAVLGAQVSLTQVVHVGASSLPVMLTTLAACLGGAYYAGRWLGIPGNVRTLVGVGTGICGASAIAAVTPVIAAAGVEVAVAVSTIFVFNVVAVLVFPLLGHALGLSQHAFGVFAGTAVNDMSSVVAASRTYGTTAQDDAVVVKLVRVLLIIPICIGLAALAARRASARDALAGDAPPRDATAQDATARDTPARDAPAVAAHRLVPWFLVAFLVLAVANSAGAVPTSAHHAVARVSLFLITVALSGLGLGTDVAALRRVGPRPLVLGAILWALVSLTSLGMQLLVGGG